MESPDKMTDYHLYENSADFSVLHSQPRANDNRLRNPNCEELTENCSLLNNNMLQKLSKYKLQLSNRSQIVDLLSIFFGISAWIGINSTFCQLPLLVKAAPEGWSLPSYLVLIIQLGNIGPLTYTMVQKFLKKKIKDAYIIYGVLIIGTLASILIAFLYDKTAYVSGVKHSVALIVLVFCFALVGCTSSVLFMPYMGRFREIYLITYLIGEGLSGFLPSIVALIQGVGGNEECRPTNSTNGESTERYSPPPRFDTQAFFIFVFSVMFCSSIAFLMLDKLNLCKKQYAAVQISHGNNYVYQDNEPKTEENQNNKTDTTETLKKISTFNYKLLMLLMMAVCFFGNGVFPAIQSYSCLPYGNVAYHLTVTLSSMANPAACFLAVFLPHSSIKTISVLIGCSAIIASYVISTALLSPKPPFVNTVEGEVLIVTCWTILVGLISYVKLSITSVMRSQGGKSLVWIGSMSQTGSAIGSIVIFCLVITTTLFKSYDPC